MAKSSAGNIAFTPLSGLFQVTTGQVQEIPLNELHNFQNHPFQVLEDDSMAELIESIQKNGVLVPGIARPDVTEGYEIVAGHRRHKACGLAGLSSMPVIVRDMDDDTATIYMVESNFQREHKLPSEKAFSYKMWRDAVKRKAGRPSQKNLSQVGTQKRSDQILAEQIGESRNQIQRYIRLTELIPALLQMVDKRILTINPAVCLSYLTKEEQEILVALIAQKDTIPTLAQSERMKKYSDDGKLNKDIMDVILSEGKPPPQTVTFKTSKLKSFFPPEYTPKQMEDTIYRLLEQWNTEHDE